MADNEKRVSSTGAQEIPLDPLPPSQLPIAGDSASEYDEVSCTALRLSESIRLTSAVLFLRSG